MPFISYEVIVRVDGEQVARTYEVYENAQDEYDVSAFTDDLTKAMDHLLDSMDDAHGFDIRRVESPEERSEVNRSAGIVGV